MLSNLYTLDLFKDFNRRDRIPLYVEEVPHDHPERRFHSHTFTELTLVLRGEAVHLCGDYVVPIKRGDILVLAPGSIHGYDKVHDFALTNLIYDHKRLAMPILDGNEMPLFQRFFPSAGTEYSEELQCQPVATLPDEQVDKFADLIRRLEIELNSVSPGNFYYSLAQFMTLMAELARSADIRGKRSWIRSKVSEVIFAMQKNPIKHIDIADMAKMAMMSQRSFFRSFYEETGCSPRKYQIQLRMKMSKELLELTNLSLDEISVQCGFYDSNYFCHLFKKHFKTTPRQYRIAKQKEKEKQD